MICAICGSREAVVFMRRSGAGARGETALCEECARERGLSAGRGRIELRLEDLISEFPSASTVPALQCPRCGRTLDLLRREARLGCPSCAEIFRPEIERWMRSRAKPPYYQPEPALDPLTVAADNEGPAERAERELAEALAAEDYEAAALIRDRLKAAGLPSGAASAAASASTPPIFALPFFAHEGILPLGPARQGAAPESDIVLHSSARVSRNLSDRAFPGARVQPAFSAFGPELRPDLRTFRLASLGEEGRKALVECGFLPRSAALAPEGLVAASRGAPWIAAFDAEDHLRVTARLPGLAVGAACREALGAVASFDDAGASRFAFDEEFGWLVSRLPETGSGASLRVLLHLPALSMTGLLERVFRGLLSRGLAVRGFYGGDEGSAGDLYEISTDRGFGQAASAMAEALEAALLQVARAERRAREDLGRRRADELADRAGRALGMFRYCRFLGEAEAAQGLSALALAAGCGVGLDPRGEARMAGRGLALLAGRLGPGCVATAGYPAAGAKRDEEKARAALARAATAGLDMAAAGA